MRRTFAAGLIGALVLCVASAAGAQIPVPRPDTTRRDTTRRDTTPPTPTPAPRDTIRPSRRATVPAPTDTAPAAAQPPTVVDTTARPPRRRTSAAQPLVKPPVTPRRALIYSLLVPGLGQSRLDRSATGAFFVAIEAGALAMVGKSAFDLAQAKAFRGDSLVNTTFPVDSAGKPVTPTATGSRVPNTFSNTLVRARRLHLEDWLAVIAFNHLIAGAEAFVSANLWDVPAEVTIRPGARGTSVGLTVAW